MSMRAPLIFLAALPAWASVSIDPPAVEAGRPATISVKGISNACAPLVSHARAEVSGSTLSLSAVVESNPAAFCAGPSPYAAAFDLPTLSAGEYTVLMSIVPACAYAAAPCPFAKPLPDSGRLSAKGPADLHYGIDSKRAFADQPFNLRLTAPEFGCGSRFSSLSSHVEGSRISLTYVHEPHPEALCPLVVGAYGPVFELPALAEGTYQVFAAPGVECDRGICAPAPSASLLAGALTIDPDPYRPFWIEPRSVPAGAPQTIALRGYAFTCNDVLIGKQAEAKDGALYLHYSLTRTRRLCMDTLFIGNEAFSLPALPAGAYPVFLSPQDCTISSSRLCAGGPASPVVDTLHAVMGVGIAKPGAPGNGPERALPGLRWRGEQVGADGRRNRIR